MKQINTTDILSLYFENTKNSRIAFSVESQHVENHSLYQYVYVAYKSDISIHITYAWLYTTINQIKDALSEAVNGQLKLDALIQRDLGYEYNQLNYDITNDKKDAFKSMKSWKGNKHLIIPSNGDTKDSGPLWMYNDQEGNIVIEITPPYPYLYREVHPTEPFVSFEEWMQTYQPILLASISKKTAQHWILQIQELVVRYSQ